MAIGFDADVGFDSPDFTFDGEPVLPPSPPSLPGGGGGTGGGLQVLVRDKNLNILGEVEYQRLELIPRYCAVGSWSIELEGDLTTPAGQLLVEGSGIAVVAAGSSVPFFSGPMTKPVLTRDGDLRGLAVGGTDDLQYVADHIASQDPSQADSPPGLSTYDLAADEREGPAESVIKQFVRFNAGQSAIPSRRVLGLSVLPDVGRGLFVEESGRQQNLLELIGKLAKVGAVGFRAYQFAAGQIAFDVFLPMDKTNEVVFSVGLGNVAAYEYSSERPGANFAFIGGSGTGRDRIFQIVEDAVSIAKWGRIETFVDETSSRVSKLLQAGRTELASNAARYFFSADAVDTGSHRWAPLNTDPTVDPYDLGDIVTVEADGITITEVIRELHVTHDENGVQVTPVVGSADQGGRRSERFYNQITSAFHKVTVQVRDLQRR